MALQLAKPIPDMPHTSGKSWSIPQLWWLFPGGFPYLCELLSYCGLTAFWSFVQSGF